MTYSLACGDVMPGCPMTFESSSRDDLLSDVAAHASSSHGISEVTPGVMSQIQAAIRTG